MSNLPACIWAFIVGVLVGSSVSYVLMGWVMGHVLSSVSADLRLALAPPGGVSANDPTYSAPAGASVAVAGPPEPSGGLPRADLLLAAMRADRSIYGGLQPPSAFAEAEKPPKAAKSSNCAWCEKIRRLAKLDRKGRSSG